MAFVITRTSPEGERIIASRVSQDDIQARIVDEAVEARLGREIWPDTPFEEHEHPIRALTAFSHIDEPPFPRTEKIIPGYRHTVREVPAAVLASPAAKDLLEGAYKEFAIAQQKLEEVAGARPGSPLGRESVIEALRKAREPLSRLEELLQTSENGLRQEIPSPSTSVEDSNAGRLLNARLSVALARSSVSWGYVDLSYSEPLISNAETPTVLFALIALDKSHRGHGLVRENHHSGYHYHYVHASERRSDVLLTFGRSPPNPQYPVTWERHGEGHAAFSPDVSGWGLRKRESLNMVCCRNAEKLGRAAFRAAGRDARFLLPA